MWKALIKVVEKWGCKHQWDLHKEVSVYTKGYARPSSIQQTLICLHCGKIKKISV